MATPGFLQFSDGDVEIYFSSDEKFVLHKSVLAVHSEWFKAALDDRWSGSAPLANTTTTPSIIGGTGRASLGGTGRLGGDKVYIFELRFEKDDGAEGQLFRKGVTAAARFDDSSAEGQIAKAGSATDTVMVARAEEAGEKRMTSINAHKDMLRTLYHFMPTLSYQSVEKAKASIKALADVVTIYGCEKVAKVHIKVHLWHFRDEVLEACCENPVSMLELGMDIESGWLFMEAGTNLLGRSKRFFDAALPMLHVLGLADMMTGKRTVFVEKLKNCELDLFCMGCKLSEERHTKIVFDFFCRWLREQLVDNNNGSRLGPGYAYVYHAIGNEKTFSADDRKTQFDCYIEEMCLEDVGEPEILLNIATVFAAAAKIVKPILKDMTRRKFQKRDAHRALTFMTIGEEDLPWVRGDNDLPWVRKAK